MVSLRWEVHLCWLRRWDERVFRWWDERHSSSDTPMGLTGRGHSGTGERKSASGWGPAGRGRAGGGINWERACPCEIVTHVATPPEGSSLDGQEERTMSGIGREQQGIEFVRIMAVHMEVLSQKQG